MDQARPIERYRDFKRTCLKSALSHFSVYPSKTTTRNAVAQKKISSSTEYHSHHIARFQVGVSTSSFIFDRSGINDRRKTEESEYGEFKRSLVPFFHLPTNSTNFFQ